MTIALRETAQAQKTAQPQVQGGLTPTGDANPTGSERRGRRWLLWSFILCPCHLPITMTVLAVIFGGTAFGAMISRNTLGVGIVFGVIYAVCLAIAFHHLRGAAADKNCASGSCEIG